MSENQENKQDTNPEEQPEEKPDINDILQELMKEGYSGKLHCPKCGFATDSLMALRQHWKFVHGGY